MEGSYDDIPADLLNYVEPIFDVCGQLPEAWVTMVRTFFIVPRLFFQSVDGNILSPPMSTKSYRVTTMPSFLGSFAVPKKPRPCCFLPRPSIPTVLSSLGNLWWYSPPILHYAGCKDQVSDDLKRNTRLKCMCPCSLCDRSVISSLLF